MQLSVPHRRHRLPAGARSHGLGAELLAAPGAEDDVRLAADHLGGVRHDALPGERLPGQLREYIDAARHADELRDPGDAGDLRLVPFLEIHPRVPRQPRRRRAQRIQAGFQLRHQRPGLGFAAQHAAQHGDHAEDVRHAAVVEDVHLDPPPHQVRGDVRLQVRETEHQVRFQGRDLVQLGARESRDLGFLPPRLWRAHREPRYPNDAVLLAQEIDGLRGLLGETNYSLRVAGHALFCHLKNYCAWHDFVAVRLAVLTYAKKYAPVARLPRLVLPALATF